MRLGLPRENAAEVNARRKDTDGPGDSDEHGYRFLARSRRAARSQRAATTAANGIATSPSRMISGVPMTKTLAARDLAANLRAHSVVKVSIGAWLRAASGPHDPCFARPKPDKTLTGEAV